MWGCYWYQSVIRNVKTILLHLQGQIYNEQEFFFPHLYHSIWKGLNFNLKLVTEGDFVVTHYQLYIAPQSSFKMHAWVHTHTYTHLSCTYTQKLYLLWGREGSMFSKNLLCGLWDRHSGNNQQELQETFALLKGAFCSLICCKKDDTLFRIS